MGYQWSIWLSIFYSPKQTITRWIVTHHWSPIQEWNYPAREKVGYGDGSFHGIQVLVGKSLGPGFKNQSCWRLRWTLSWKSMRHGSFIPSHREALSAKSLLCPAMWDVSTSIPVDEIIILNFSVKSASGMVVVNRKLETLSVDELSDNVRISMGMRKRGWNLVVTKISAICAKSFQTRNILLKVVVHRNIQGLKICTA